MSLLTYETQDCNKTLDPSQLKIQIYGNLSSDNKTFTSSSEIGDALYENSQILLSLSEIDRKEMIRANINFSDNFCLKSDVSVLLETASKNILGPLRTLYNKLKEPPSRALFRAIAPEACRKVNPQPFSEEEAFHLCDYMPLDRIEKAIDGKPIDERVKYLLGGDYIYFLPKDQLPPITYQSEAAKYLPEYLFFTSTYRFFQTVDSLRLLGNNCNFTLFKFALRDLSSMFPNLNSLNINSNSHYDRKISFLPKKFSESEEQQHEFFSPMKLLKDETDNFALLFEGINVAIQINSFGSINSSFDSNDELDRRLKQKARDILAWTTSERSSRILECLNKSSDTNIKAIANSVVDSSNNDDITKIKNSYSLFDDPISSTLFKAILPEAATRLNLIFGSEESTILAAFFPINELENVINDLESEQITFSNLANQPVYFPANLIQSNGTLSLDSSNYGFTLFSSPRRFFIFASMRKLSGNQILVKVTFNELLRLFPPFEFYQLNPIGFFTRNVLTQI